MVNESRTVRLKPEIDDWVEDYLKANKINWTSFCYDNIYRVQKKNHIDNYHRHVNRIAFVFMGCILVSLTYAFPLLGITYIVFMMAGITFIVIGSFSFLLEVKPYGKRRR